MRRSRIKLVAKVPIRRKVDVKIEENIVPNEEGSPEPNNKTSEVTTDQPEIAQTSKSDASEIAPFSENVLTKQETNEVPTEISEVKKNEPAKTENQPETVEPVAIIAAPKNTHGIQIISVTTLPTREPIPSILSSPSIPHNLSIPESPSTPQSPYISQNINIPPSPSTPQSPYISQNISIPPSPSTPQRPTLSIPPSPTHYPEFGATYPRPPTSPCKVLNRPRIRSTPRLSHRRNSTSASESEDDSRRTFKSRIRNDSVSSVSATQPAPVAADEAVPNANIENSAPNSSLNTSMKSFPPKKKVPRSDIARKMAEARKEFYFKFGTKTPDRHKLTMMDLIFYNPTSNPMPVKPKKSEPNLKAEIPEEAAIVEEEADEPEEEAMPVPQVKIGENGELILDEQSLVIETSDTRKTRELTTTAINYDDLDTGYGIYKRAKRTKDWSLAETKQFYRVLQMIGTDFSLMLGYFKNRTRRDLKLKFKKEEKLNRALIDKVLLNPRTFNLDELQKTLDQDQEVIRKQEEEKQKLQQQKEEEALKRRQLKAANGVKKRLKGGSYFARQMYSNHDEMVEQLDLKTPTKMPRNEIVSPSTVYKKKRVRENASSDESNDEQSDEDSINTVEEINKMFLKPTRSGRVVKPRLTVPEKPKLAPKKKTTASKDPTIDYECLVNSITKDKQSSEAKKELKTVDRDKSDVLIIRVDPEAKELNTESQEKSDVLMKEVDPEQFSESEEELNTESREKDPDSNDELHPLAAKLLEEVKKAYALI